MFLILRERRKIYLGKKSPKKTQEGSRERGLERESSEQWAAATAVALVHIYI